MTAQIDIITFGCRLNTYESEVMRAHADAAALDNTVIVNTCAVTAEAQRQARQAIRRARRERPDARIVVTGCAAQIDPASFAAMDEVDLVLGNEEKLKPSSWHRLEAEFGSGVQEKVVVNDIMSVRETASHMVEGFAERTRAFVQIQNGCDHRCTFCIIPFGRGNSRSVPAGEVVAQVRNLVARGYREVVLTGVDITAYGTDLPGKPSLGGLARRVLKLVPELERLRLSSLDSVEADESLMRAIAEEARLMPHFHLSLQSGDNMILKRMKRRHLREHSIDFCAEIRRLRPDAVFGADFIAGFPTETEAMFSNSCRLVDECGLTYLHVFPYSPRPGTPAARMPQVPGNLVKQRAARLRVLGEQKLATFLAGEVGARRQVLAETEATGRTQHYALVHLAEQVTPGAVVTVEITEAASGALVGRVLA